MKQLGYILHEMKPLILRTLCTTNKISEENLIKFHHSYQ